MCVWWSKKREAFAGIRTRIFPAELISEHRVGAAASAHTWMELPANALNVDGLVSLF
jgi:hypothetical protein